MKTLFTSMLDDLVFSSCMLPCAVAVVVVAVVYLHDITTYINIREISQMNHANKDLKEVKNL